MRILKDAVHALTLFVCGMALVMGISFLLMRAAGIRPYVVVSGSMSPGIPVGSLALIDTHARNPEKGDVAAYHSLIDGAAVIHRVAGYGEDGSYLMKGDANNAADSFLVKPDQIEGTLLTSFPEAGYVLDRLRNPSVMMAGFVVPVPVLWCMAVIVLLNILDASLSGIVRDDGRKRVPKAALSDGKEEGI